MVTHLSFPPQREVIIITTYYYWDLIFGSRLHSKNRFNHIPRYGCLLFCSGGNWERLNDLSWSNGFYPRTMWSEKNNLCFFYDNFLRTWPQSVSFHTTHLYSFSSLQSVPHAPMNPIPSYPRDTWVLFICCHCWKRNMHLVLLMHIDRISPGKHNCAWRRWKTSSPTPSAAADFLACFLSYEGAALRGSL